MIAILDYGSGNLRSAERAFATSGEDVVVTSDRRVALEAEGLVVPGVGAFAACMNGLNAVDGGDIVLAASSLFDLRADLNVHNANLSTGTATHLRQPSGGWRATSRNRRAGSSDAHRGTS